MSGAGWSASLGRAPADTDLLRAIMETCHEGIVFIDLTGQVVSCNPSAERILGVGQAILQGRRSVDPDFFFAVDESGRPFREEDHPSQVVLRTGRPCLGVVQGLRSVRGFARWIHINATPLYRADGALLSGVVVSVSDITPAKTLEERLRREAYHDELTGLPNRRHFLVALGRAMNSASRHGHALSLCMADLDHFKAVNDTHGHATGDRAIQAFGECLAGVLRQEDLAARLGGDEFCALFSHAGPEEAVACLERVRQRLAEAEVRNDRGERLSLTGSFGVAAFHREWMDPEAFLAAADAALYRAKARGRNRIIAAMA